MGMLSRRWRSRMKFWELAIVLAVIAAALAIGISLFMRSFYSYAPGHFEPKDVHRGTYLERGGSSQDSTR
jgi:cytochrome c-type biogenesis protein CcmE